jgi:hypothetical protein
MASLIIVACSSEPPSAEENQHKPARSARATVDSFHLPRDLEIQLAESALPKHLQERATIYVLNPRKGFEIARWEVAGDNAFVYAQPRQVTARLAVEF